MKCWIRGGLWKAEKEATIRNDEEVLIRIHQQLEKIEMFFQEMEAEGDAWT